MSDMSVAMRYVWKHLYSEWLVEKWVTDPRRSALCKLSIILIPMACTRSSTSVFHITRRATDVPEPAEEEERESKTGWAFGVVKLERARPCELGVVGRMSFLFYPPRAARPEHSARASRFFENEHFPARQAAARTASRNCRETRVPFPFEEIPPIGQSNGPSVKM